MKDEITFGKYSGKSVDEVATSDPAYLQWLVAQDWFRSRDPKLYERILNGGTVEDSPDHNRLQALFLDDTYCFATAFALGLYDPERIVT